MLRKGDIIYIGEGFHRRTYLLLSKNKVLDFKKIRKDVLWNVARMNFSKGIVIEENMFESRLDKGEKETHPPKKKALKALIQRTMFTQEL
jgi:hypothetical protein